MSYKNLEDRALRMLSEKNYTAHGFGAKVRMEPHKAEAFLESLVEQGKIVRSKTSRFQSYYVPPKVETDPRMPVRYIPEPKEMKPYDMRAFQRLCEGARNNERGYV